MPDEIVSSDQIDDWLSTLGDEGIEVVDGGGAGGGVKVPTARRAPKVAEVAAYSDGDESEEASPRSTRRRARRKSPKRTTTGYSKTNDPVRMYLRKMGSVSLLTREGEVEIAKRIEEGERRVLQVVLNSLDRRRGDPRARRQAHASTRSASRRSSATSTRKTPSSTRSGTPTASCKLHRQGAPPARARTRLCNEQLAGKLPETKKKKLKRRDRREQAGDVRAALGAAPQQEADREDRPEAQGPGRPHREGRSRDRGARAQDRPVAEGPAQDAEGDEVVAAEGAARIEQEARPHPRGARRVVARRSRTRRRKIKRVEEEAKLTSRTRCAPPTTTSTRASAWPSAPRASSSRPTCASSSRSPRSTRTAACSSST